MYIFYQKCSTAPSSDVKAHTIQMLVNSISVMVFSSLHVQLACLALLRMFLWAAHRPVQPPDRIIHPLDAIPQPQDLGVEL